MGLKECWDRRKKARNTSPFSGPTGGCERLAWDVARPQGVSEGEQEG
jgi:hypothetical protein